MSIRGQRSSVAIDLLQLGVESHPSLAGRQADRGLLSLLR